MSVSPSTMIGRGLAATGALLWILSLFLTFYSRGSETKTFWELQRYNDVLTLVLAVVVLIILAASLFLVVGDALLPAAAAIGGYMLGIDVSGVIEPRYLAVGAGGYVGVLGAAAITFGALMAIAPTLAGLAARGVQEPAIAPAQPERQASGPKAGWYADPKAEARLRYWDGWRWSDNTRT